MDVEKMNIVELKFAVAERVMGLRPHINLNDGLGDVPTLYPNYPTSIAAAMQVVEKMRQDDFWWKATYKETIVEGIYQAGYSVTFRCVRAGTRGYHTATALTLSEATCRAAVMAAEAE